MPTGRCAAKFVRFAGAGMTMHSQPVDMLEFALMRQVAYAF